MKSALRESNIWITGASSGIGLALAQRLAGQDNRLFLSARRLEPLEALARHWPDQVITAALDLTAADAVAQANGYLAEFTLLDLVVVNAGTCEYVDVRNFEWQLFERVFQTNLLGAVKTIEAALPWLRLAAQQGRQPRIAIVSSASSWFPFPRAEAYGSSKAALDYLAHSLRADLAHEGIGVSLIAPGFIDTPLTQRNDFPMPGLISAEEAARRIVRGLEQDRSHIYFPKRFTWPLGLLARLPSGVQQALARKLSRN